MTKDEYIVSYKYSVLQHVHKNNNITDIYRLCNISRTPYNSVTRSKKFVYLGLGLRG
jgi:hypothetical protein